MKKLLLLICGLLIIIVGFFVFSVFYSKNKVDLFFNVDNGFLYNRSGFILKTSSSDSKIFNGKYTTEFLMFDKKIVVFEHEAKFGLRSFNIFNIGSIKTTAKFIDTGYEFNISSDVKFNGINAKADIKENSKEFNMGSELFTISWKDIKTDYFTSFERDIVDFKADMPYISTVLSSESDNISIIVENQKYASSTSERKVGIPLGYSSIKIGKMSVSSSIEQKIYDDYYNYDGNNDYYSNNYDENGDYYSDNYEENSEEKIKTEIIDTYFTLSDISMISDLKDSDNLTIILDNKLSLKNLTVNNNEKNLTLDDVVFNISLQNIDLNSAKNIIDSFQNINIEDEKQLALLGLSYLGYIPNILSKHPKISFDELSLKYKDQTHKLNGFIQYVGNGDLKSLYVNIKKDIKAKFDISIGDKLIKNILRGDSNYYDAQTADDDLNETFEYLKTIGFTVENGMLKGVLEYQNGDLLINEKSYPQLLSIFNSIP
jgi:hypothetical protein